MYHFYCNKWLEGPFPVHALIFLCLMSMSNRNAKPRESTLAMVGWQIYRFEV